eukprot:6180986-Pleurochrysis_carterae.AAC.1
MECMFHVESCNTPLREANSLSVEPATTRPRHRATGAGATGMSPTKERVKVRRDSVPGKAPRCYQSRL